VNITPRGQVKNGHILPYPTLANVKGLISLMLISDLSHPPHLKIICHRSKYIGPFWGDFYGKYIGPFWGDFYENFGHNIQKLPFTLNPTRGMIL
jgi:hypothetical protein